MTAQEAFTTVYTHFVHNHGPASVSDDARQCRYRGENGACCAIGLLIPDEIYDPSFEKIGAISCLLEQRRRVAQLFAGIDLQFLTDLQRCHDHSAHGASFDAEVGLRVWLPTDGPYPFHAALQIRLDRLAEEYALRIPKGG